MERITISAHGHENVRAAHASTLELTTDDWLTPAGDCILGIAASQAPADFPEAISATACNSAASIELELVAGDQRATITGRGDPALTFADDRSMVVRTSTYVDDRTVMVGADTAAKDIDRQLVEVLQSGAELEATFTVYS